MLNAIMLASAVSQVSALDHSMDNKSVRIHPKLAQELEDDFFDFDEAEPEEIEEDPFGDFEETEPTKEDDFDEENGDIEVSEDFGDEDFGDEDYRKGASAESIAEDSWIDPCYYDPY